MITSILTAVFLLHVCVYNGQASCFWRQQWRPHQQWHPYHQWEPDTPWSWGYADDRPGQPWTPPPPPRRPPPPRPTFVRPITDKATPSPTTTELARPQLSDFKAPPGALGPILVYVNVTRPPIDFAALLNKPPRTKFPEEVTTEPSKPDPVISKPGEDDPCAPFPRILPDFRAAGRRVSLVKCYEYIWGIKYRLDKVDRAAKCVKKKEMEAGESFFHISAIGGRDATAGEFPHMGAIGWKAVEGSWIFKCGGSLISDKFVLTAAHCTSVSDRDDSVADIKPKIVRLGDKNILGEINSAFQAVDVNILRTFVHPQYESPKKYHDIALFELEEPVKEFTYYVQPACLWGNEDTSSLGKQATLTGWGVIDVAKQTTSPVLQAAVVDIIEPNLCDQLMRPGCNRNWCGLRNQICGGKLEGGVDSCQGDSGGPLQVKINLPAPIEDKIHYVIGVTSFGIGCARPKSPGIYTRVSSYIDWIESIVWP